MLQLDRFFFNADTAQHCTHAGEPVYTVLSAARVEEAVVEAQVRQRQALITNFVIVRLTTGFGAGGQWKSTQLIHSLQTKSGAIVLRKSSALQ